MDDFERLMKEALADPEVRCAYKENGLRRRLAGEFEDVRKERGLTVRALAKTIGTSPSQVQRLLHHEVGGSLTLSTIVRAADALDLSVTMCVQREVAAIAPLVSLDTADWKSIIAASVEAVAIHASRASEPISAGSPTGWTTHTSVERPSAPPLRLLMAAGGG